MSHFTRIKTEIKDREALLQALADLGYNEVEEGQGLSLYGWRGDVQPETAEIVVVQRWR